MLSLWLGQHIMVGIPGRTNCAPQKEGRMTGIPQSPSKAQLQQTEYLL
jgi:hypothetical protein